MGKCLCCFAPDEPQVTENKTPLVVETDNPLTAQTASMISASDFKIEKLLGKGSFGKVFLVTKSDTGTVYAMKVLKKNVIEQRNQRTHTATEREILETIESPFIVQLHFAFQTPDKLYMVMDYAIGGELFYHLKHSGKFTEYRTKFYAAEILTALEHLHTKGIIYRDLKPENILLDADGHIKLSDFGLSKKGVLNANTRAYTFCGTPEYLAPEILKGQGHDKAVDFWSLGALMYEMMTGAPPFYSKNREEMFRNILTTPVQMKSFFSQELCDLLQNLLEINVNLTQPDQRFSEHEQVKRHPFFEEIEWKKLSKREIRPPYCPKILDSKDTGNFDPIFTDEVPRDTPSETSLTSEAIAANQYAGFTYTEQSHLS